MKWIFLHTDFVEADKASIPISDLAIQRGYGVFDYLKVINETPVFLDEHLDRFIHSALIMRLPMPFSIIQIKDLISKLIALNDMGTSGIRLTLTGGSSYDGMSIGEPKLIIEQSQLTLPDHTIFQQGIKLVSYPYSRTLPQAKSINYLMAIWLQDFIKEQGANDVLYHTNNVITECPRANMFVVTKDDQLVTPQRLILKGITRKKILKLGAIRLNAMERDITLSELYECKEAFITSTTKMILPVLEIDKKPIGNGSPGEITAELLQQLKELQSNVHQ
jgi:D-alanine transaminase/branched-chain amino acid aminotransferase